MCQVYKKMDATLNVVERYYIQGIVFKLDVQFVA